MAICEQLEKPSKEKKIVKRGVTDIVTPGVGISDSMLDQKSNNFLASAYYGEQNHQCSIALLDLSTGEFLCTEGRREEIDKLIHSFQPAEILYSNSQKNLLNHLHSNFYTYGLDEWIYGEDFGQEKLLEHFKTNSLKGFGIENLKLAQIVAGSIIYYLQLTENDSLNHISRINRILNEDYMWLDQFSMKNLELVNSLHPSGVSLLQILDHTKTPMGARLLRKWIMLPLTQIKKIHERQEKVTDLFKSPENISELDEILVQVGDMERLVGKVAMARSNPKELFQLKKSLLLIPFVKWNLIRIQFISLFSS